MILIVETITWKPHLETAMDVALQRRNLGEDVVYCNLRPGLPIREDDSPIHAVLDLPSLRQKRACKLLVSRGVRCISPSYKSSRSLAQVQARQLLADVRDNTDFVNLRYGKYFDVGWGALSSAISVRRDSTISYGSDAYILFRFLCASIMVYEQVRKLIDEFRPDSVLLFNGRFATTRAVMRASQSMGVPFLIHERGCDKNHYLLSDYLPHDIDYLQKQMLGQWKSSLADAGRQFFLNRRNRVERDWHSFTAGQTAGRVPNWMRGDQDWITFFTSSDDEMIAVGDKYGHPSYPTQVCAIKMLSEALGSFPNARLCVRVHPHVAKKSRNDRRRWSQLPVKGAFVIGPDEDVDSYTLMERSKVIVTYGSTMGIEATHWGKPSMLLGRAAYDQLDVCAMPSNMKEIREFLKSPYAFPTNNTLPFGAYMETFGEKNRYYEAETLHRGKILGVYLDDSPVIKCLRSLRELMT